MALSMEYYGYLICTADAAFGWDYYQRLHMSSDTVLGKVPFHEPPQV